MKTYNTSILIVDDNPTNLKVLGNSLTTDGYKIDFALNGEQALQWLKKRDFDLILLDVMMPGMDGYEVCRIIKKNKRIKEIPVIFLTAKTLTGDLLEGFKAGGVDYITKPFDSLELKIRLKTHLDLANAKKLIKKQVKELKLANETLEQKVVERTKEIQTKKEIIELKNKELTDSILYARRIQKAILPPGDYIETLFPKRFILYLPKDIVSGDFYWIKKINNKIISVVADCTGHGVPGAFMSLLGIAFLNDIVYKNEEIHANEILNELRDKIIHSLRQTGHIDDLSKDGIDVALYMLDENNLSVEFSGANNPLYIVRNEKLITIKPDRMPIGIHYGEFKEFTNHKIDLDNGDILYTSTDGYYDQFGGKDNKKLKLVKFKELLIELSIESMEEQERLFKKNLREWMGDNEQVDDILLMGVKI